MTGEPMHTTSEMVPCVPATVERLKSEVSIMLFWQLCSTRPLHSISNQELFEKHLCNQNSHYEKYGQFLLQREAITCYHQINTFCCQQRLMGHKGGDW